MGQIRQLIKHVQVEPAKAPRRCRRDASHTIAPGEPCLVIRDESTLYKASYCSRCALPILKRCAGDLRMIRDALYPLPRGDQTTDIPAAARPESAISSNQAVVVARKRVTLQPEGLLVQVYDAPADLASKPAYEQ